MAAKKILILGGSSHFGKCFAMLTVAAGFEVTCVTRGNHPLPEGVRHICADRKNYDDIIGIISSGNWDFVLDNLAFVGDDVERVYGRVSASIGHLCVASSCAVYRPRDHAWREEEIDFSLVSNPYADGKRAVENVLPPILAGMPYATLRFPVIITSLDETGRLKQHIKALQQGCKMEGAQQDNALHFITAMEAASFIVHLFKFGLTGAFNVGPDDPIQYSEFLNILRRYIDEDSIMTTERVFSSPYAPVFNITMDNAKAVNSGFKFRTVHDSIVSVLDEVR